MAVPPLDPKKTYLSVSRYCEYQDRCEQEVRLKLQFLGVQQSKINSIIDQLVNEDLINEERFSMNYARGKFRIKQWGRVRIRAELRAKGISTSHITKALNTLDPATYQQAFHELAVKKLESLNSGNDQVRRKKLWNLLIYRGWEKGLVYDKIKELIP